MINSFLVKLWLLLNRDSMKKMKHIKTTRLYEEFILLMLDIKHIVKEDKLFIFLCVIQPWVHMELRE